MEKRSSPGRIIGAVCFAVAFVAGCILIKQYQQRPRPPLIAPSGYVAAEMYPGKWPLTVPEGVIGCEETRAIIFSIREGTATKVYTVNAEAEQLSKERGDGWPTLAQAGLLKSPSADLAPLLDVGQDMCRYHAAGGR